MKFTHKLLAGTALSAVGVVAGAAPAFAYDCYNASRSTQGSSQAANNSGVWWNVAEALVGFGCVSNQAELDAVMVPVEADSRVPANFAIFLNPKHPGELARAMPSEQATNFKGIDHSGENGVLMAVFEDIASVVPDAPCLEGP
jgi:hypothetical protein